MCVLLCCTDGATAAVNDDRGTIDLHSDEQQLQPPQQGYEQGYAEEQAASWHRPVAEVHIDVRGHSEPRGEHGGLRVERITESSAVEEEHSEVHDLSE